jgi:hypothetical protein
MTLPHTTKLVRVGRKGYLWSRHCDRGRREGEANPSKHPNRPILSEELPTTSSSFHRGNHPTPIHSYALISISG